MTNREKSGENLQDGDNFAVTKNGEVCACNSLDDCLECLFNDYYDSTKCCDDYRSDWMKEEYTGNYVITEDELKILDMIDTKYKYMARDKSGILYLYEEKPTKNGSIYYPRWKKDSNDDCCVSLKYISNVFQNVKFSMVKWESKEPWEICKLKKLKIAPNRNDIFSI